MDLACTYPRRQLRAQKNEPYGELVTAIAYHQNRRGDPIRHYCPGHAQGCGGTWRGSDLEQAEHGEVLLLMEEVRLLTS